MAGQRGCSCHTSTSGRAPNGCVACDCWLRTSQGSGSRWDTTITAIPGKNSATLETSRRRTMALIRARLAWQRATVLDLIDETPRVRSLVLDAPNWQEYSAGQHLDVRLTAEDGYQTERSYSVASAPADPRVTITV